MLASVHETFNSRVFETTIPQNIKLNEAQSNGKAIFDYDADCKGAEAYMNLAKELLTTKKGNHREQHIGNK